MNCKGLISALGRQSQAYLDPPNALSHSGSGTNNPAICPTIEMMSAMGIEKSLISLTTQTALLYRQLASRLDNTDLDISYLLLDDNSGICRSILAANEFAAQSNLFFASAGLHCIGQEVARQLNQAVSRSTGVTAFRMRSQSSDESLSIPEMLVIDRPMRDQLRGADFDLLSEFAALRQYCETNLSYSEVEFDSACLYVDMMNFSEAETP